MSKREVVKDLEYWARLAGAYKERRRIRRAILPALRHLKAHAEHIECGDCISDATAIDRATKAPKRKATKGTR